MVSSELVHLHSEYHHQHIISKLIHIILFYQFFPIQSCIVLSAAEEKPKKKKASRKSTSAKKKPSSSKNKKPKKVIKPDESSKAAKKEAAPKDTDLSEAILGSSQGKNTMKVCRPNHVIQDFSKSNNRSFIPSRH